MSATAATATDLPGEGFFSRTARKARALANKAWRGTVSAAKWIGHYTKRGAQATGRGALVAIGGVGWLLSGALKLVLGAIALVATVVFAVVGIVLVIALALVVGLAAAITYLVRGLRFVFNYLWDGSNWLVRGRPGTWKVYRHTQQTARRVGGEYRVDSVLEKIGLVRNDDDEVVTTVPVTADEAVRLRVFDEDKSLVDERFFASAAQAHEFADERYNAAPVVSEVTPVSQVIDEYASEDYNNLSETEKVAKADEIAKAMLGVELLGTEGENIDRLRALIDDEVSVPTPVEQAAAVYSSHDMPEGLAEHLDQDTIAAMEDPKSADWVAYMYAPEVPAAYRFFANQAKLAGDKKELSYWNGRLWMREHQGGMNAWRQPAKMFALFLNSVNKATIHQGSARQGVYDECKVLTEVSDVLDRHLEEQDLSERSVSAEQ